MNEYWCPWDEAWIHVAVSPDHWCPTPDTNTQPPHQETPMELEEAMNRILHPRDYDEDLEACQDALGTVIHELGRQYGLLVDARADFPGFDQWYDALVARRVSYIDVDGEEGVYDLVSWVADLLSIARDGRRINDPLDPHQDFINRYWFGPHPTRRHR